MSRATLKHILTYYVVIVGIFLVQTVSLKAVLDTTTNTFVTTFTKHYKRPITIFEICGKSDLYSLSMARNKPNGIVAVVILLEPAPAQLATIQRAGLPNVLVLQPGKLTRDMIKNLARCEQPDIVLVHDLPAYAKSLSTTRNSLDPFLDLGDYLFFNGSSSDEQLLSLQRNKSLLINKTLKSTNNTFLAVFRTGKKGLAVPRWSSTNNFGASKIQYHVTSNFKQKRMHKTALNQSSEWHKGINLLTFVMMNGVYPSHAVIRKEIEKLSSLKHNDLVIGNLLIQGNALKPIDFNDKRRSIDVHRCLEALLLSFRYSSSVFKDPAQLLRYYQSLLLDNNSIN